MAWTPEKKNTCLDMVKHGYSCAAIQEVTGFTVGQVSGFAKRAGLVMRDIQGKRGRGAGIERLTTPTPALTLVHRERIHIDPIPIRKKHVPPKTVIETRVGSDKPLTIMELNMDHCRWMLDAVHYCGALTIIKNNKRYSYCAVHFKKMYQPPRKD